MHVISHNGKIPRVGRDEIEVWSCQEIWGQLHWHVRVGLGIFGMASRVFVGGLHT